MSWGRGYLVISCYFVVEGVIYLWKGLFGYGKGYWLWKGLFGYGKGYLVVEKGYWLWKGLFGYGKGYLRLFSYGRVL